MLLNTGTALVTVSSDTSITVGRFPDIALTAIKFPDDSTILSQGVTLNNIHVFIPRQSCNTGGQNSHKVYSTLPNPLAGFRTGRINWKA